MVEVWWSCEKNPMDEKWFKGPMDYKYKLSKQPDLQVRKEEKHLKIAITVNPHKTYQKIYGIGASLEEATIYNLSRMSVEKSEEVIRALVDPKVGIGMNMMRICFGSPDFSGREYYSYNDLPENQIDIWLENFSIQKDIEYNIIPTIQKVFRYNPDLKIIASPWSPPGWMKTSGSMCGGSLKPEYYEVAARYYTKCIQAYEKEGIPVYAFTIQNEPYMETTSYPSCRFIWQQQRDFVKEIKAAFVKNNITTKILILDHNFDIAAGFAGNILKDQDAFAATDGIAFHDYKGEPGEMSKLKEAYPDKDIYFTERSTWGTKGADRIIQYFKNWSSTYNAWVTMLDSNKKPNGGFHKADPTFVIQNVKDYDDYWYIPEYYILGQFTKFIKPGAIRIWSDSGSAASLSNIAFMNPDNSLVLIVVNQQEKDQSFLIQCLKGNVEATIPANTVATYRWNEYSGT